jgi:hypothetical protein
VIRRADVATRRSGFFSLLGDRIRYGGALESGSELRRCPRCAPGCPRATLIGLSSGSLALLPSVTRSSHKVMAIAMVMYQEFLTSGMYPSVAALNAAPHDLMTCMVLAGRRMVEPGTYQWHEPFHAR